MNEDIFDFGFTAVSETELVEFIPTAVNTTKKLEARENAIDRMYQAILPLLDNLSKDPEKSYILWPNRYQKIEQFRKRLDAIYQSDVEDVFETKL